MSTIGNIKNTCSTYFNPAALWKKKGKLNKAKAVLVFISYATPVSPIMALAWGISSLSLKGKVNKTTTGPTEKTSKLGNSTLPGTPKKLKPEEDSKKNREPTADHQDDNDDKKNVNPNSLQNPEAPKSQTPIINQKNRFTRDDLEKPASTPSKIASDSTFVTPPSEKINANQTEKIPDVTEIRNKQAQVTERLKDFLALRDAKTNVEGAKADEDKKKRDLYMKELKDKSVDINIRFSLYTIWCNRIEKADQVRVAIHSIVQKMDEIKRKNKVTVNLSTYQQMVEVENEIQTIEKLEVTKYQPISFEVSLEEFLTVSLNSKITKEDLEGVFSKILIPYRVDFYKELAAKLRSEIDIKNDKKRWDYAKCNYFQSALKKTNIHEQSQIGLGNAWDNVIKSTNQEMISQFGEIYDKLYDLDSSIKKNTVTLSELEDAIEFINRQKLLSYQPINFKMSWDEINKVKRVSMCTEEEFSIALNEVEKATKVVEEVEQKWKQLDHHKEFVAKFSTEYALEIDKFKADDEKMIKLKNELMQTPLSARARAAVGKIWDDRWTAAFKAIDREQKDMDFEPGELGKVIEDIALGLDQLEERGTKIQNAQKHGVPKYTPMDFAISWDEFIKLNPKLDPNSNPKIKMTKEKFENALHSILSPNSPKKPQEELKSPSPHFPKAVSKEVKTEVPKTITTASTVEEALAVAAAEKKARFATVGAHVPVVETKKEIDPELENKQKLLAQRFKDFESKRKLLSQVEVAKLELDENKLAQYVKALANSVDVQTANFIESIWNKRIDVANRKREGDLEFTTAFKLVDITNRIERIQNATSQDLEEIENDIQKIENQGVSKYPPISFAISWNEFIQVNPDSKSKKEEFEAALEKVLQG